MIQGTRMPDGTSPHIFKVGQYGKYEGVWYGMAPASGELLANLANHQVAENPDGSITVRPSILVGDGEGGHQWHGYLTNGVWTEC
jgi:hypothetical protein